MNLFLIFILCFPNTGVIIVDDVWFYGVDGKSRILATGDLVEITGKEDEFVKVKCDNTLGTLNKDILIDLSEKIAEDKLFVFARGYFDEKEYKKSTKLFGIFIENFSTSEYLAEALYYDGLAYEQLARNYNKSDSIQHIIYNRGNNSWCYDGSAYQAILQRFPKSIYAAKAQYQLIRIFRMKNAPWNDSVPLIQEELNMWQRFTAKYKKCGEYVLALLETGYLNRVLFQITKDINYKREAVEVFQAIIKKYPNSVYSTQAKVNSYEIENNIDTYSY